MILNCLLKLFARSTNSLPLVKSFSAIAFSIPPIIFSYCFLSSDPLFFSSSSASLAFVTGKLSFGLRTTAALYSLIASMYFCCAMKSSPRFIAAAYFTSTSFCFALSNFNNSKAAILSFGNFSAGFLAAASLYFKMAPS